MSIAFFGEIPFSKGKRLQVGVSGTGTAFAMVTKGFPFILPVMKPNSTIVGSVENSSHMIGKFVVVVISGHARAVVVTILRTAVGARRAIGLSVSVFVVWVSPISPRGLVHYQNGECR